MPDPSYHRCDSLLMFKASDDQNKNILAINQFGKIIYAGYGLGYGYASPSDKTYYDGEGNLADKECFILKDNFVFFKDRFSENQRDKYKIITKKYNVTINSYSSFAIFSDYKINDTIAMTSYSSSKRHRCLANESYKVSDNPDDIIIAIDKDNKIIYMTNQSGYGYGSPSDNFYMANKNKEDLINKCFILNNNFQYYKKGVSNNEYLNYEFVIPEGGMIIIGNSKNKDFVDFLQSISYQQYNNNFFNNPWSYKQIPCGLLNLNKIFFDGKQIVLETIQDEHLYQNYEFVVPKKGFVIIGDNSYYDFLVFISLLFDNKYKLNELKDLLHNNELFEEQTINGQFNKFTCELVDDTLTISRQYTDEEILLDKISQKNNLDIDNLANILEKRIYQNILNKLKNDNNFNEFITNLISEEIDDIRAEIDDLK